MMLRQWLSVFAGIGRGGGALKNAVAYTSLTLETLIQLVWDGAQALVIFESSSADSNVKPELKTPGLT